MGICNECKVHSSGSVGDDGSIEAVCEMNVGRISTCDRCRRRYWTAKGESDDRDVPR